MSVEQIKPGYKRTEVGVIPEDWASSTIGEVCSFSGGSQPPRYTFKFTPSADYIRLIQIRDYKSDSFETYIPESLAQKRCTASDIMIGRYGPPVFQILRGIDGAYNVALIKVIPSSRIDREYLFYVLRQEKLFQLIDALSRRSSGQTGVDMPALKEFGLPLPSIPEQISIATALSDVDALLAKLDQLITKKRDLKQAAMQQLLTGQTRLPGFSGDWEVKRLGDVLTEIGDGATPSTAKQGNFGGSIAWVVIEDIKDEIWTTRNTLTDAGLQSCAAKLWPIGTLIISTGATIGEVGIARTPLATKQGICGLVFDPKEATSVFMKYWFASNKSFLLAKAQGSSIKEVRAPTLVQFEVALPKVTEQTAIATALSDMDAELAALEARRDKTRALKQGMMQKLLTGSIRLI